MAIDPGCFLNVDLDIYSKVDLQPLVDALGNDVSILFVGRVRRTYEAHLELRYSHKKTPSKIIQSLCKLIEMLPSDARQLWDEARLRTFDIGIDAPSRNGYFRSAISPEAVIAAAKIGAQIAITVYGPMKVPETSKGKRTAQVAK